MKAFDTIKEIKEKIENREISPSEVTAFFRERLKKYNPELNVAIEIFEDTKQENIESGLLGGIPGILKDNICQKRRVTSAGSKILKNFKAPYDAAVSKRLKAAGAPIIGRANCDEFAMGCTGEFTAYGPTKNPWNTAHVPGGSSSGSAAAVAAGLVPWAIGTETGGSVRQPAAFCNLVGLYPTYGLHSRYGIIAFGSSLDQPGPITRTVYDNALLTSVIAGHDPKDSTSLPEPKRDYTRKLNGKLPENITIGIIKDSIESEGVCEEVKKSFKNSVHELEKLGAKIKYIDIPDLKYGISVYFVISRAEAASNLSRIDGAIIGDRVDSDTLGEMYIKTRSEGFGPEVKRRILMGNYVLSAAHRSFYEKASHVRAMIRAEFEKALSEVDILTSPTTSALPFEFGQLETDPLKIYMGDYFNCPSCVAGLPAISVPSGFSQSGLPIGIQFIGPRLSEEMLFQVGHAYEKHHPLYKKHPEGYE
ncbi:Asp-tRNA(Asn)/Glu-tRNA(Gln) amidotransferase subunit GatA [Candidatus Dependentiae bacterium]